MENKKENSSKKTFKVDKNTQMVILLAAVLLVACIFKVALNSLKEGVDAKNKANISEIIEKKQTKVVFVENTDKKKCKKCDSIKKALDEENISYVVYDAKEYSKEEYESMLNSINIKPADFGYPAVIYIRKGKLYSNVINVSDKEVVKTFINDYKLDKIK